MSGLRIIAAAIRVGETIVTMPQPARHGHLLEAAYKLKGDVIGPDEFGFLTNTGQFARRYAAKFVAATAGQLLAGHHPGSELFSEDVW